MEHVEHEFPPEYDGESRVLILGSIPSPKSREQGFYYGHPRNRFWSVLADVFGEEKPETVEERKAFLHRNHIALWDVLASCEIKGAEDSSIQNPVANDLSEILEAAPIERIYTTGGKAAALYKRYCLPETGIEAVTLPSTSLANCGMKYETVREAYQRIRR